jgi:hypothetical protein
LPDCKEELQPLSTLGGQPEWGEFELGQGALLAAGRTKHPGDAGRARTAKTKNEGCRESIKGADQTTALLQLKDPDFSTFEGEIE